MSSELARNPDWDAGGLEVTKTQGMMSKGCHVCRNGYNVMATVNRLLVNGAPVSEVFEFLNSQPHSTYVKNVVPSLASIRNHSKNHLPIKSAAMRKVLEQRAAEYGMDIENGANNLLTTKGMAEVIAQQGFADIVDGKSIPNVKETLEAIKLVAQFDKETNETFDGVAAMAQVHKIMTAIQLVVPKEYHDRILAAINSDTIEGTIVEDDDGYFSEDE